MAALSVATWKRIGTAGVTVVALVGALCSCSRTVGGIPTVAGTTPATVVADDVPAADGPTGLNTHVPDATLPVDGTDNGQTDKVAKDAVSDVDSYWAQTFPQLFGARPYAGPKRLLSYDSGAPGTPLCAANTAGQASAFYCPTDDSVDWDRGQFLPQLTSSFGQMGVVTAVTQAMSRLVEQHAGTVPAGAPPIVATQQADCFTGAFYRYLAGKPPSAHFQLSTSQGLNQVMGSLSYLHDTPPGAQSNVDTTGTAFDEIAAFRDGFTEGPGSCTTMNTSDVQQRTRQTRFWNDSQSTDLPITAGSLGTLQASLGEVFGDTAAATPTIASNGTACSNAKSTSPAMYCPDTNTVSVNIPALQKVATMPQKDKPSSGYGNFAAYADVASRYVLAVELAAGFPLNDQNAGLRTACFVGAWSGLHVERPIGGRAPVGTLRIAPSDVNAEMAELLNQNGLVGADINGDQAPAGFARVDAFQMGFSDGMAPCAAKFGSVQQPPQ